MKKYILGILMVSGCIAACNSKDNKDEAKTSTTTSAEATVALPYKATYTTEFTHNGSDSDLLAALNFYKYWETGDMKGLRSTLGDSVTFDLYTGDKFYGPTDSSMKLFTRFRDSLSSVSIEMITWLKNYSAKDSAHWVNVWYKEIDTYKGGKKDSTMYEDDNLMRNGKMVYYSSHSRPMK